MERTLQVLDYAILVINGMDGVQSHTMTLWRLLERYQIPTFLFVNKMDQQGTDHDALLNDLKQHLHENCVDFGRTQDTDYGMYELIQSSWKTLRSVRKTFWKHTWKQTSSKTVILYD